jgi:adenylate cyclase
MPSEQVALNADVVGYSALIADDLEAMTRTMRTFHDLVEAEVSARDGVLANFVGDQFMAVFDGAIDALGAAIAITKAIEEHNAEIPPARRARFRMGLDLGPVEATSSGYHGDALNIAARVQAAAPPGGISVSGRVYRAIDEPELRFRAVGTKRMKNIPEGVDVYEFADLPSIRVESAKGSLDLDYPTVAILPIHTDHVDDQVRSAAEVLRADLVHRLARVPQLNLIDAQATVGGNPQDLNARYMLETGVHQFGDTVRLFATLFDVGTINVVKSHKWTAPIGELVAESDEIADEVAGAIEVELIIGEPAQLYATLDDPEAIERIYLGWYHFRSDVPEEWAKSVELFDAVHRSHPEFPYGAVLKAYALWMGMANGWVPDPEAALEEAHELALWARAQGDPTGMGQALEAAVAMSRGDNEGAAAALEGLADVRPTCDVTYGLEGSVRRYLGDWEKAVAACDVAMRLTGLNKPWYPTVKAASLFVGGQTNEAAIIAQGVLEHQPNNLEALLVLAAAQVELGLERRAAGTAGLIRERFPSVDVEGWLDKTPYQRREVVDRWKDDLAAAGAIA